MLAFQAQQARQKGADKAPMSTEKPTLIASITAKSIAPCGMNCGICLARLREKNVCPGCNADDTSKPKTRKHCQIKNCEELRTHGHQFCFECAKFPCTRLRNLDKRYRTKYGMSMIDNLESLREVGLDRFVAMERSGWSCQGCGGVICVHRDDCMFCGHPRG